MTLDEYVSARGQALLRFAYLLCSDRAQAEDTVQDVLVDVLPRWDRLDREVRDMDAYMRRAVMNKRNSWWRRRLPVPVPDVGDWPVSSHDDQLALRASLWQACAALPVRQRAAVILRYYEDLPYETIAEILDCPVGTAKSLVSRGVAALRPLTAYIPR